MHKINFLLIDNQHFTNYSIDYNELYHRVISHKFIRHLLVGLPDIRVIIGGIDDVPQGEYFMYLPLPYILDGNISEEDITTVIAHIKTFDEARKGHIFLVSNNINHAVYLMDTLCEYIVFATHFSFLRNNSVLPAGYVNELFFEVEKMGFVSSHRINLSKDIQAMRIGITQEDDHTQITSPTHALLVGMPSEEATIYDLLAVCCQYLCKNF